MFVLLINVLPVYFNRGKGQGLEPGICVITLACS